MEFPKYEKCQNSEDLRILVFFPDLRNFSFKYSKMASKFSQFFQAVAGWISVRAPRRQKRASIHMACKGTYKRNFTSPKKCQNPGNLIILSLFRICEILLVSTLTGHVKCRSFSVHCCAELCEHLGSKSGSPSRGL
jgi:hypothetical protein